jgi:anti-sigma factor RsiW
MVARSEDIGTDALLVAYLDGELEPEAHEELERRLRSDAALRSRLTELAEGVRPIRASFEAVLKAAPRARLEMALASAVAKATRYRRLLVAAAAALLLLLGGAAGYFVAKPPAEVFEEAGGDEDQWIDAVVGQMSLYDAASVAAIEVDETKQKAELAKVGQALNLYLSEPMVTLEGLTLKRAELLSFQGHQVAQLLYASDEHGPVELCIMAQPGGESEGEVESREGLNFIYWTAGGRRFLLIGAAPANRIDALADKVAARFGT